jgi:hypothetical protein
MTGFSRYEPLLRITQLGGVIDNVGDNVTGKYVHQGSSEERQGTDLASVWVRIAPTSHH